MFKRSGFVDVTFHPFIKEMQSKWTFIRDEALGILETDGRIQKFNAIMANQDGRNQYSTGKPKYSGKNSSPHLRVVPDLLDPPEAEVALSDGAEDNRERRRSRCPITMALFNPVIEHIGNIGFNNVYPGCNITPHYGVITANTFVRVHLGLKTDSGCIFYIENETPYVWEDGKIMAFHDGSVLHWVEHKGLNPRLILSVDIKKAFLGIE